MDRRLKSKAAARANKKKASGSHISSNRGSKEQHAALTTGRSQERARDKETKSPDISSGITLRSKRVLFPPATFQDEDSRASVDTSTHSNLRPVLPIHMPDNLKSLLVDDWENVTKNKSLLPLPSEHSVSEILFTYFEAEKHKRRLGSAEAVLFEDFVAGFKDYFDKCIGLMLLYAFERKQYAQARRLWEKEGINASDVYGAEHLCRLLCKLPELIAQTNMDDESVSEVSDEIAKFTHWLAKNSNRFFTADYETPGREYAQDDEEEEEEKDEEEYVDEYVDENEGSNYEVSG